MTLTPGARLGPYQIESAIGAGGIGEVYRARDPRLGRDVAIKVLPAALSADPDRLHLGTAQGRDAPDACGFDRSADGKHLIIARGILSRDTVMIRNFR